MKIHVNEDVQFKDDKLQIDDSSSEIERADDLLSEISQKDLRTVYYGLPDNQVKAVEFLIRESSHEIGLLKGCSGLHIRAGTVEVARVLLGLVLFRFRVDGPVYLTAWNYFSTNVFESSANPCVVLCGTAQLIFRFVGDSLGVEENLVFNSSLSSFFTHYCNWARDLSPWDEKRFCDSLTELYCRYPEAESLWKVLT